MAKHLAQIHGTEEDKVSADRSIDPFAAYLSNLYDSFIYNRFSQNYRTVLVRSIVRFISKLALAVTAIAAVVCITSRHFRKPF
jgi:hypothetical protein